LLGDIFAKFGVDMNTTEQVEVPNEGDSQLNIPVPDFSSADPTNKAKRIIDIIPDFSYLFS
jgi:hypothetical protein